MFTVRPYKEEDAAACGDCFYEGFFSCSVDQNDKILLRDYAQILIEKCNFTYVAETEDHQVVGFICGNMISVSARLWQLSMRQKSTMAVGVKCSSSSI